MGTFLNHGYSVVNVDALRNSKCSCLARTSVVKREFVVQEGEDVVEGEMV